MKARTYFFFILLTVCGFVYVQQGSGEPVVLQSSSPDIEIPEQAMRLRILANSDHVKDQWLKRQVRDQVIAEIKTWAHQPKTLEEARLAVKQHLPRFQQIAEETLAQHGFSYSVKVDYGQVPFPTKLYGNQVYPAGEYEALRITLGEGKGDNWWCVLFPPLCFVDMSNGDAVPQKEARTLSASIAQNQVFAASKSEEKEKKEEKEDPVEVRFLLIDQLSDLFE